MINVGRRSCLCSWPGRQLTHFELLPNWDGQDLAYAPHQLPLAERFIAATNFREGCSINLTLAIWCLDCENINAHEYTGKERSVYCGDINLFAEFLILPGRYASPEFIGNVYRYSYIISLCIVISGFSYAYYRTRKVNSIIQNHFQDWQERGIMVEYHPAKHGYTRRGLSRYEGHVVRGHLDLTLPPIQAVASPPYPTS